MNVAREMTVGNTRIKIATDFCEGKSKADVDKVLEAIVRNAKQHFQAAERNRNDTYGESRKLRDA